MYVRYALTAPLSLAFNLFVILTCPIWANWAAFTPRTKLPGIARWVHTHDDDIYGSKTTGDPVPGSWFRRMKRAMWWLCRNPGYGFDAFVLGFKAADVLGITATGGPTIRDGFVYRYELKNGTRFFYRRDIHYGSSKRYCKLQFGWKHQGNSGQYQIALSVNPFKSK